MLRKIVIVLIFLASCKKGGKHCPADQVCENALVSIGNQTEDTIFFGLQKNYHDTFIPPGGVYQYHSESKVKVTYRKGTCEETKYTYSTGQLSSTEGEWAFHIDHCRKTMNFRYDDAKVDVSLYNDSEE